MKKISFLLLSVLISLFSVVLHGQADFKDGFIITLDNDTLHGQIDFRGNAYNSENCRFRTGDKDEIKEYKPGEIKGYMFSEGKYFITKEVEILVDKENKTKLKITAFLEYLVEGKASLYYLLRGNEDMYFIEKEGAMCQLSNTERFIKKNYQTFSVMNEEYKGILLYQFRESPELKNKITNMPLNQNSLIKITQNYHNNVCPDERCTVYAKKEPKTIIAAGPAAIYNLNKIKLTNYSFQPDVTEDIVNSSALACGLNIDFFNNGKLERFLVSFLLAYYKSSYTASFGGYYPSTLEINTNNYSLSLSAGYKYPRYKLKPYFTLGVMHYKTFSGSSYSYRINYNYEVKKKAILPTFAIGAMYNLGNKFYLKAEPSYSPWSIFRQNDDNYITCKVSNFNFSLSILYLLNGTNK